MRFDLFKGCMPRIDPALLPEGYAALAENVDVRSGTLRAMKQPRQTLSLSTTTRAVFRHQNTWRQFAARVDIAPAFAADGTGRIYMTGDGAPKQSDSALLDAGLWKRLGLSAPETALTITFTPEGGPVEGARLRHSVAYTYTRVNRYGEESAPAPETVVVDLYEGQGVVLSGFVMPADTSEDVVAYRVYRAESAGYFWIHYPATPAGQPYHDGDMPAGITKFTDFDAATGDIREESLSTLITGNNGLGMDWTPPPPGLTGICSHVGGIWAGFVGNTVYVSEIMAPYAWPAAYQKPLDTDIVALVPWNEALVVLTRAHPYVITGTSPESMIQQKLPYPQSCMSKDSVASTPYGVLYASPDGLCLCTSGSCEVVTRNLMTAEQWREWDPANTAGFWHDERYFLFSLASSGDLTGKGMMIDFRGDGGLVLLDAGKQVIGGLYEPTSDILHMILADGENRGLFAWEGGEEYLNAVWASPVTRFAKPVNLACGVAVYAGDMAITIDADGYAQEVLPEDDAESFWLESGFRARDWQFTARVRGEVKRMRFGFSKEDLA